MRRTERAGPPPLLPTRTPLSSTPAFQACLSAQRSPALKAPSPDTRGRGQRGPAPPVSRLDVDKLELRQMALTSIFLLPSSNYIFNHQVINKSGPSRPSRTKINVPNRDTGPRLRPLVVVGRSSTEAPQRTGALLKQGGRPPAPPRYKHTREKHE